MARLTGVRTATRTGSDRLATHQTGHNSGVIHAGIYYKPGSLKASLCSRGRDLLHEFSAERSLPYDMCGKLVVAIDESELGRIDALERTATENRVPGLTRVGASGIAEIEPHAVGLTALHSPATAITDFVSIARAYGDDIEAGGGRILLSNPVSSIERRRGAIEVTSTSGVHRFRQLVVCAGLHADRVSRTIDGAEGPRIVPFRGEYMAVTAAKRDHVRGLIYPVPDPRYPFLGVHFTRRVSGELEVGPNAVLALSREGYRWRDIRLADVRDMVTWPGFWRMAGKHWRTGVSEVRGSLSVAAYMKAASRYVPEIGAADVVPATAGVRAQAVDRDGSLVDDFRINDDDGVVTIRNAPSPAATSSLAIAEYVVDRIKLTG